MGLIKNKTDETAALEIGNAFPTIKDKLINFLQLQKESQTHQDDIWLKASSEQKANDFKNIKFTEAININKNNRKTIPWLLMVLSLLVGILMFYPYLITDSAERLLNPSKKFEPQAPFKFEIQNKSLSVIQNQPIDIVVKLTGRAVPNDLSIVIDNKTLQMKNIGQQTFSFHVERVIKNMGFKFFSDPYYSSQYEVSVFDKFGLDQMKVYIKYPSHLGKKDEWITSLGDMQIPEGSTISWSMLNPQIKEIECITGQSKFNFNELNGQFHFIKSFLTDTNLLFVLSHKLIDYKDSLSTHINIIKDQSPTLSVERKIDTTNQNYAVLIGDAADDNGLSSLAVIATIKSSDGRHIKTHTYPLGIANKLHSGFKHLMDFTKLNLSPGSVVDYYVQAVDNDVVHGGKSIISQHFEYNMPSKEAMQKMEELNSKEAINALSSSQSTSKKADKLLEETQKDLLNKSDFSFEDKENFRKLLQSSEDMKKTVEQFQEKLKKQKDFHKEMKNESLKEQENELEKIAEDIVQKKIEEQMKRIQDLMEKLDKKQAKAEQIDKIKEENKNLQNELERLEELAKRLELQVKLDKLADKVDATAFEELKLANKINQEKNNNAPLDDDRKKQDERLNDIAKDMEQLDKDNKELESPIPMEDAKSEKKEAESNIMHSDRNRKQNNMPKASSHSSQAAKNLQKMAEMLQDKANGEDTNELEEDIAKMRRLLQNLMKISFNQEQTMNATKQANINSPELDLLARKQNEISQQTMLIEDSLNALANKDMKIGAKMKEELVALKSNLNIANTKLENREAAYGTRHQQFAMMHVNNLTLYFGESLNSNMAKLASKKQSKQKGDGMCKNPGGNNPSPGSSGEMKDIITKQSKLGDQMKQAMQKKQGKDGKEKDGKDGKEKDGKDGKTENKSEKNSGQNGNAERMQEAEMLARLAKAHEDLRNRIQNLNQELKKNGGKGVNELNDLAKELNKQEEEILNRRLTAQMLARQEEILSKMLKAEDAIRQQEQDNKRQGTQAKKTENPIPPQLLPYLYPGLNTSQKFQTVPPTMTDYYQEMLRQYMSNTRK